MSVVRITLKGDNDRRKKERRPRDKSISNITKGKQVKGIITKRR